MQLIDEGDDLALGGLNLIEHGLEAFLEFAAVLRAGDHGAQIQADEGLSLEGLGDVASHDAAGQALHDGGFAHAGFANEHWVILRAAAKHLDHAADFLITADDRVDLALAGARGEVRGVLF